VLGPLTLMKVLGPGVWVTLVLLPQTASKTNVRCDVYVDRGRRASAEELKSWNTKVEQDVSSVVKGILASRAPSFSYQCGGKCNESDKGGKKGAC
jgi:hypothetical protein